MIIAHLALLAVAVTSPLSTSPLLCAVHAGSFCAWACEYLKREKDFVNRLSVLFPT